MTQPMTPEQVQKLYLKALEAFPGYTPKTDTPWTAWATAFEDDDPIELDYAIDQHAQESRFFPSVAELRAIIKRSTATGAAQRAAQKREENIWQPIRALSDRITELYMSDYARQECSHEAWQELISGIDKEKPALRELAERRYKTLKQVFG